MSYKIIVTSPFEKKLKKLAKKHKSIRADLFTIIELLSTNPTYGTPLEKNCYKIRIKISSKAKGKTGGARLITLVQIVNETVFLMDIYDKSNQTTISDGELKLLIDLFSD